MPGEVMPPTKVFVGRLSSNTKSSELRKLFEKYGEVTECDILGTYGFVHMRTSDQADAVIDKLSGYELQGSRITVEHSTGQRSRNRGGGGGGRHYNGSGGGGYSRNMRAGGGGGGGYRGYRGADRYSPYGRPSAGYGGYSMDYPMERRASHNASGSMSRSAPLGGGSHHYDDYDRRDMYSRSSHMTSSASRYADPVSMAAYERRPPSSRADPYAAASYSMASGGSHAVSGGSSSLYGDRRDGYGDMYGRRSPPRYQTDGGQMMGSRGSRGSGGGGGGYETYDRYGSPPRRVVAGR